MMLLLLLCRAEELLNKSIIKKRHHGRNYTINQIYNYIKCSIEFFLGKINSTKNYSNTDLNQFNSFLNPIACDQGATMYCSTKSGDIINNTYNISYLDSNVAQNRINKMLESRFQEKQVDTTFYEKMCFQWAITSFKQNKKVIDKIIIDNISRKPLKVLFINESDKISATTNNPKFPHYNWQDLIYVADIEVCFTAGRLSAYKIVKLHTEDTFVTEDTDDYSL